MQKINWGDCPPPATFGSLERRASIPRGRTREQALAQGAVCDEGGARLPDRGGYPAGLGRTIQQAVLHLVARQGHSSVLHAASQP